MFSIDAESVRTYFVLDQTVDEMMDNCSGCVNINDNYNLLEGKTYAKQHIEHFIFFT
jgi:hypothetical protein